MHFGVSGSELSFKATIQRTLSCAYSGFHFLNVECKKKSALFAIETATFGYVRDGCCGCGVIGL